jgi:hypothetical protein
MRPRVVLDSIRTPSRFQETLIYIEDAPSAGETERGEHAFGATDLRRIAETGSNSGSLRDLGLAPAL